MSMTRWGWWMVTFVCVLSACVTTGPGNMLTELPKRYEWCGAGPQAVPERKGQGGGNDGLLPSAAFEHCSRILHKEIWSSVWADEWSGSIVFGLNTDEAGQLTSVCVWGGNYGNVTSYLDCLGETMLTGKYALPPNLKKARYTMTFISE